QVRRTGVPGRGGAAGMYDRGAQSARAPSAQGAPRAVCLSGRVAMTRRPEERSEWILSQLEGDGLSEGQALPGDTEMDRAELAREVAGCRETWRALGKLDERIASETPSPRMHSAFQAQLADAI